MVRTAQGRVLGRRAPYGVEFRGIRYGLAPRGALRFAPPVRVPAWGDDVVDARFFGDAAPQEPWDEPFGSLLRTRPGSEDCLSLNVWTPDPSPSARMPVMVWIHGGGYADESGSDLPFHGHEFARDGIVLVTINYRLGALGYLHVAESFGMEAGSGNFGALDQIAALEWVQENIVAFGGDPGNVTIFGESAGGWAVSTLLASDRARGLFRRAIAQSGSGDHVLTPDTAQRVTDRFLHHLGIKPGDVDGLLGVDTRQLLQAQGLVYADSLSGGPESVAMMGDGAGLLVCLMPVTTGEVVSDVPTRLVARGAGRDVDLLIGSNAEEYGLYRLFPGGVFTAEQMLTTARAALQAKGLAETEGLYRTDHPGADDFAIGELLENDRFFRLPVLDLAEAHSAGASAATYLYELAWSPTDLGACHVLDVPLVFDRLHTPLGQRLTDGVAAQPLASLMHRAWVDFATAGDPDPFRELGWLPCTESEKYSFVIDEHCHLDQERDAERRRRWRGDE
ncbi:carboxylesterase/lipase family protein [Streptomyces sp. NPDC008343]|uniref:carboxylesterase/lipase family protein n=1 Tax=Streptomyces sp. NPDC008343 TaxID=3364828 RepID=UPI0036F0C062